jgi:hypothetical protein
VLFAEALAMGRAPVVANLLATPGDLSQDHLIHRPTTNAFQAITVRSRNAVTLCFVKLSGYRTLQDMA